MKDKIIEILSKKTETAELINRGVYADVIEDGKFEDIAESIVKLFAIPDVVGRFYTEAEIKEIKETEYKKGLYFEGY